VAEGIVEAENFPGTSSELLTWMMLEWWRRYGATKASGISKLMMSEAGNFPELAQFFRDNVIQPAQALVRLVLQRGIDRGEFRAVDVDNTIYSVMAPLIFLVMEKHSTGACSNAQLKIDPEQFITHHADLLVRGMALGH
jgi:TetR/AcrR family transcriptional regulator